MLKNITRILPFFIVTLLCIGGVELFYGMAERYFLVLDKETTGQSTVVEKDRRGDRKAERHQDYSVIIERNLFQSYLVEEEPETVVEETNPLESLETTKLDLVLMGTITGEEGRSRAIILDKRKNKQDIFYRGDVIEGAEVKEILRGKIILNYQEKDQVLDMSEAATMRPAVEAAVSPASPVRRVVVPPTTQQQRQRSVPGDVPQDEFSTFEDVQEEFQEQQIEEPVEIPEENIEQELSEQVGEAAKEGPGANMENFGTQN
ncbi:MAG: type II secretion system protein N [Desulfopila sp.]|jgi:type II secretory pathway component PulC|nr:type II secretion system protein N [Desulfopila sp.]